jgi:hypothetical protein
MIGKKILAVLGILFLVVLLSGIGLLYHPKDSATEQPLSAQQPVLLAAVQQRDLVTAVQPAPSALPPIAGKLTPASAGNDGKTVQAPDGKTVLPFDGKETLPPVGQLAGQNIYAVNPAISGAPVEFLNKNPLLNPPNPVNVSGPVVSAETKSPP